MSTKEECYERMKNAMRGVEMYYDKEGKEISVLTWGALSELGKYTLIKSDSIGEYKVSTIWKGMDLNELFETAIFCDDREDDLHCMMSHSKSISEALESHKIAVCSCEESANFDVSCDLSDKIDECNDRIDGWIESIDDIQDRLHKMEHAVSLLTIAVNRPR